MADTTNLTNFLQDVADAIKEKKEYSSSQKILAANFDTEIASIETGIDTSDATAIANDILAPKTAYVNGEKLTGTIIPTYGEVVPTTLSTPITYDSSINLWGISYSKKIAIINTGTTTFSLVKIINNQINYTSKVDFTTADINLSYSIMNCKISPSNNNRVILWIFGKSGINYSLTRCVINPLDLSITSYKTVEGSLGRANNALVHNSAPRPNYDTDAVIIVGYNPSDEAHTGIRLYRYDENTDSFSLKSNLDARTNNGVGKCSTVLWSYWTDDGNYLLTYSNYATHCSIDKFDSNGLGTRKYSGATQRRVLNNGYYVQGTTVYNEEGQSVGTSAVDFSSSNSFSLLHPLIFIRNSSSTTALYQFTDDYNIIKVKDIATTSSRAYSEPNKAYLYDIGGQLAGYIAGLEPDIIGLNRNNTDYIKLYQATGGSGDILLGKKVYNNNGLIVGTMPNNGAINITPSTSAQTIPAGYTSGGVVNAVALQSKTATPTTSQQIITPDSGNTGLSSVTVSAVDNTIDGNIQANNIKTGVTILGVTGTLDPDKPDQNKTCTPTTSQQVIQADTGYELAQVTVEAVDNTIDNNIQAENIKKDVTILGVAGTFEQGVMTQKEYDDCQELADLIINTGGVE